MAHPITACTNTDMICIKWSNNFNNYPYLSDQDHNSDTNAINKYSKMEKETDDENLGKDPSQPQRSKAAERKAASS